MLTVEFMLMLSTLQHSDIQWISKKFQLSSVRNSGWTPQAFLKAFVLQDHTTHIYYVNWSKHVFALS